MASNQTIDLEVILKPLPGDNPAGVDIREANVFETLKEARREEEALIQGDWKREVKVADWAKVVQIATKILTTESKDLQVATWLLEGLVKRNGFAGLRDGIKVLQGLHEHFWQSMFPQIEDGDLEFRSRKIEALTLTLPVALKLIPIVKSQGGVQYSYSHYEESRLVENLRRGGAQTQQKLVEALAEGKIDGEHFDKAVAGLSLEQGATQLEDLGQCREALDLLDRTLDEKYKESAPSLRQLVHVVDENIALINSVVEKKGGVGLQRRSQEAPVEVHPKVSGTTTSASGGSLLSDRADALRRLSTIAEFFRRTEPHSPVSYLVQRAARWGEMPLEKWLQEVIKNEGVLGEVRETLGLVLKAGETQQNS